MVEQNNKVQIRPYASWSSPLTAAMLASKGTRYGHFCVERGILYWLESRASEKGRGVIMRFDGRKAVEVLPSSVSVRSRVYEYGGADFCVHEGVVYFVDASDQNIYRFDDEVHPVTRHQAGDDARYADLQMAPHCRTLVAVREQHKGGQVINDLVSIDIDSGTVTRLHGGFDFYAAPRFSPNGHRLAWLCWNQPDMPWDASELWVGDFHRSGQLDGAHRVTGGYADLSRGVSVVQPSFSPGGVLHFIADSNDWYNLYSMRDGLLNALTPMAMDFAPPQWVLGQQSYVNLPGGDMYVIAFDQGVQKLCHLDSTSGHMEPLDLPFNDFGGNLDCDGEHLYFVAASPTKPQAIYQLRLADKSLTCITGESEKLLPEAAISCAESIWVSVDDGKTAAPRPVHALYYKPLNPQYQAPKDEKPPLIVMSHGGPTAQAEPGLNWQIQFWTSRGFAVVDVNYSGSTGFGRAYRDRLKGQWGILDVADCVAVAKSLAKMGKADANRLLIRGGSAGGFTTLCALTFYDCFAAGMSRYGVADLHLLASDSHKFEARYLDSLVGPLPEAEATYRERSPLFHTDKLNCPLLILQGSEDKVVPVNQAEALVKALDNKGLPYAYVLFEGEGHGFRMAQTIETAFNAELSFYRQILHIESDEAVPEINICNLGHER